MKRFLVMLVAAALAVAGLVAGTSASGRPVCPGNSCHASTSTPGTTTTATTTATVPTTTTSSSGSPSGEAMPGDIPGWRQVFADDFTTDVPLGSFPAAVSSRWQAYPCCWTGTPSWAVYDPARTTSFHDGMQDIWIHTDPATGQHLIAANEPVLSSGSKYQLYGRYAIRYRTDSFQGYKPSWLLWPQSEQWPRDGEIDFPEADSFASQVTQAYMHHQDATSGGDQDYFYANVPVAGAWHTAVVEWLPSRVSFILDGVTIGTSTSRIPNTPMRYVIQNGGWWSGTAAASDQGHVLIDWVAVYAPA